MIRLAGVRTHNLKNIDVEFPQGCLSVVTGVSGSGKSSLVFSTLYSEAYRLYLESLSGFARQHLEQLPRAEIDEATNLAPAIAIRQNRGRPGRRSTVASITGVMSPLQTIYASMASVFCPECRQQIIPYTPASLARQLADNKPCGPLIILAPLIRWKDRDWHQLLQQFQEQGFNRIREHGKIRRLEASILSSASDSELVIDRISDPANDQMRLQDALKLAFKCGLGFLRILDDKSRSFDFFQNLCCQSCQTEYQAPSFALFSWQHPAGACPTCQGSGTVSLPDLNKIIPDQRSSLAKRGLCLLNSGSAAEHWYSLFEAAARKTDIPIERLFKDYSEEDYDWLISGDRQEFIGIQGYLSWLESKQHLSRYRIQRSRYLQHSDCPDCKGGRFAPHIHAYRLDGTSLPELLRKPVSDLRQQLQKIAAKDRRTEAGKSRICGELFRELEELLSCLERLGAGYLSLDRKADSLSGGELQKIHLARCLSSQLTRTLYCLDEPSSALHAVDREQLSAELRRLCQTGNTVVMVEHDSALISMADHTIQLGPGSGEAGGYLSHPVQPAAAHRRSGQKQKVPFSPESHPCWLTLSGPSVHHLKKFNFRAPLGKITVICGPSGSGKSTLLYHCLLPSLQRTLTGTPKPDSFSDKKTGVLTLPANSPLLPESVYFVDQSPLAGNQRSVLLTWLNVWDTVRKELAKQERARHQGMNAGYFSFNRAGGRCDSCLGLGFISENLSFLGDVRMTCPDCQGKRFSDKALSVYYRGKNIHDMMQMTAADALVFFKDLPTVAGALRTVTDLGLGYMRLGQTSSSYSGGEIQRLKLADILRKHDSDHPACFLLDEPASGLADEDIHALLLHFRTLCSAGHSMIIVTHHLALLRSADYLLELGPCGGDQGGQLLYQGTPEKIIKCNHSITGKFLQKDSFSTLQTGDPGK